MVYTYSEEALKIAIAQLAHNVGWHSIGSNSFEILIDITARFMKELAKTSTCIANQYNRTQVNFDDLQLAFNYLGISLNELEDYYKNVDSIPFVKGNLVKYPVAQRNVKRINYPDQNELKARANFYEEWMPSIKLDLTEDDNLLNSKITKDNQLDDSLNGIELDEEELDRRYLNSLKNQVGTNEKIGGFTGLSALVPNYIYLSENGEALSFGGKQGKLPECTLPPLTEEDQERIRQEEELKKQELQKEKEKTFQPLKLKINNKDKFRKYLKDPKLKNDYMSKELLKRAKKDKKMKPKLNLNKLSIKMALNNAALLNKDKDDDNSKSKQDLIETAEKLGLSQEINEIKKLNKLKERTQKEKKIKILKEEDLEKARRKRERMRKKQEELERKQRLREERRLRKEAREREKEEKRKARERKRMERLKAKENKGPRKPRTPKKLKQQNVSKDDIDDTNSNFSMNSSSMTNSLRNNTSTNSNLNEYDEKEAASILVSLSEDKKSNKKSNTMNTNKKRTKKESAKQPSSKEIIETSSSSSSSSEEEESDKDDDLSDSLDSLDSFSSTESKEKAKSKSKFKLKNLKKNKNDSKSTANEKAFKDNQQQPTKPTFKSLAERKAMPPEILDENNKSTTKNQQINKKLTKIKKLKKKNEKVNNELDKLFEPSFTLPTIKKKAEVKKTPKKKFNDDYIETSSSSSSEDERALISKKKDDKKKKKKDDSLTKFTVKIPSRTNSPILSPKMSSSSSSKKEKLKDKKDEKKSSKKDQSDLKVKEKVKEKKDDTIKKSSSDKQNLTSSSSSKLISKSTAVVEQPIVENKPKKKAKIIITPTKAARKEAAEKAQKGCVLVTQTVSTNDADDKVWYCPSCSKPDDGSPMIGCDNCDSWFHWSCLGITSDPTEDSWFCEACINKQQQIELKFKKKRKSEDDEPTHYSNQSKSVGRPSKASLSSEPIVASKNSSSNNKSGSSEAPDSHKIEKDHKKAHKKSSASSSSTAKPSTSKAEEQNDDLANDEWICPGCKTQDDGTPMIGCDQCNAWWHFRCCNLVVEPEEGENWYCSHCLKESTGHHKHKKQKKS